MKIPNTELQQATEDDWTTAEKQAFDMIDEADERLVFVHIFFMGFLLGALSNS